MNKGANVISISRTLYVMAIILAWLAVGLSAPVSAHEAHRQNQMQEEIAAEQSAPTQSGSQIIEAEAIAPTQASFSFVDFLGRLHPAAVHFPIALLIFAALAELALIVRPTLGLERTVSFLLWSGALSGIGAVILGWFAGGFRLTDRSDLLFWHRWNGTAIIAVALLAALAHSRKWNSAFVRLLVFSVAIALIVQGYLGGELAFGPDHLNLKPKGGS